MSSESNGAIKLTPMQLAFLMIGWVLFIIGWIIPDFPRILLQLSVILTATILLIIGVILGLGWLFKRMSHEE